MSTTRMSSGLAFTPEKDLARFEDTARRGQRPGYAKAPGNGGPTVSRDAAGYCCELLIGAVGAVVGLSASTVSRRLMSCRSLMSSVPTACSSSSRFCRKL